MLGLGSILGTGVFVSVGLVAGLAGVWTPVVVLVAAFVATCNALSSAQLAARFPVSGGTYEYGYELIHPAAGFTAGWSFLLAKSASAATAALGFAGYVLNALDADAVTVPVWLAGALVVMLTALVASGVKRSNAVNIVIVSVTILALIGFVTFGFSRAIANWDAVASSPRPGWRALLEATALMFVAYTGYGRVATLGEEVHDPVRTIPKAIVSTLVVSAFLYLAVVCVAIGVTGGEGLLQATEGKGAPLEIVARGFGVSWLPQVIAIGAVTAMAGVLLNLLLGLSRVLLAMGRRGDMPSVTAKVSTKGSPVVAVLIVGAIILALTLIGSIRIAWSFSAFTVLVYYTFTNWAALRLPAQARLYPRVFSVFGLCGCAFLAWWVEPRIWLIGTVLMAIGLVWYAIARSQKT